MKKNFYRATISERDFQEAEDYLLAYPDGRSETVQKALLVAAVIAYGRPFTNNELDNKSKASTKVSLLNERLLTDEERLLHTRLMELRNKAVAHSEFSNNPVSLDEVTENSISFKAVPFNILKEEISISALLVLCRKRRKQAMDTGFSAAQKAAMKRDAL